MSVSQETFELFTFYVAIKSHFTTDSFDYFKYGGRTTLTPTSFENRRDKSFFQTVTKRARDPKSYVFANLLNNPKTWIGDIAKDREKSDKVHLDWEKRMQSLSYIFKEEIGKLESDFNLNFVAEGGRHPPLLKLYLANKISLETFVILDMILSFTRQWDRQMKSDPVWSEISRRVKKYKPFLSIDLPKFKKVLQERFV